MSFRILLHAPIYLLAAAGVAALALGAMLATPLKRPPTLASIHEGAQRIDATGKPEFTRFQARDGTWLAYRLYPAADGGKAHVALLAHGSSASSDEMNAVAKTLAAAGVAAVALDVRGHGASGQRGDIGYIGEMEDDLADLLDQLHASFPDAHVDLIGHSLGGGFAARIAGTPVGKRFDRFVLLAPFLGAQAPTNREGGPQWAEVDLPRIIALTVLGRIGLTYGQSLPVIAYANAPSASKQTTSIYSYRLLADYGPDFDWRKTQDTLRSAAGKVKIIAGLNDELMNAPAYESELKPLGVDVTLLPGLDHMGVVYAPAALSAIVAAVKEPST